MSDLVKCVYLFSISSESHKSCVQINEAANHKILLTDSGLLGVAELPSPNHVAVTSFYTEQDKEEKSEYLYIITFSFKLKIFFQSKRETNLS